MSSTSIFAAPDENGKQSLVDPDALRSISFGVTTPAPQEIVTPNGQRIRLEVHSDTGAVAGYHADHPDGRTDVVVKPPTTALYTSASHP